MKKIQIIFIALCMPLAIGCSDDISDNPSGGNGVNGSIVPELNVPENTFPTVVNVTPEQAADLGLTTLSIDDEGFEKPILKDRRTVVDMRADKPGTVLIELEGMANIRWDHKTSAIAASTENNMWYRSSDWVYNAATVNYGPVAARSLSPTLIEITRLGQPSAEQIPIEIYLERQMIDMIPVELGTHATIVVELTDTPLPPSDPDAYAQFINRRQAEEMGLFYMEYDDENFGAPILDGGETTIRLPEISQSVTVTLKSPAEVLTMDNGDQFSRAISGKYYRDIEGKAWIFNPHKGQGRGVEFEMTDPYHITIIRPAVPPMYYTGERSSLLLSRGDQFFAYEAGQTYATIHIELPN